jgi:hypothetical protein
MNRLTREERAKVLQLLCEGMAIRAVSRVTGASKNTIVKLLADAGAGLCSLSGPCAAQSSLPACAGR